MRKIITKISLLSLCIALNCANLTFSHMSIKDAEYDIFRFDYENTYANLNKSPSDVLGSELFVLGDSFAFLLSQSSGYNFNYIVHQGYCLQSINENLINEVPDGKYKYCFLFIGPNDFMNQTEIFFFQNSLIEIINKLKNKGMKTILTSYLPPDFSKDECKEVNQFIPIEQYDLMIKGIANLTGSIYFDIRDLFSQYKWIDGDYIHPNRKIYRPIMDRLISVINDDKRNNSYVNTQ